MAINSVIHTNEQSIDRVLNAGLPVVLVFWRDKSPAAAQLDPVLDQLARDYQGKALIAKVNVTDERALAKRYNVTNVPTLVFTRNGTTEGAAVGATDLRSLTAWLEYLTRGGAKPALPSGPSESISGGAAPQPTYTNGKAGHGSARPQASSQPVTLTDANFAQIIGQTGPVLVDFWAPWCGPCRMVAPAVEQLAGEFSGRAVVGKLNVDENPVTAQRYGIMSIPALYIFKNGQVVDRIVGAQPAHVLRQKLMQHV
jgi:thioredoxin 1